MAMLESLGGNKATRSSWTKCSNPIVCTYASLTQLGKEDENLLLDRRKLEESENIKLRREQREMRSPGHVHDILKMKGPGANGMGDPALASPSSRGPSDRNDSGCPTRAPNYPLKRPHQTGRLVEATVGVSNGLHREAYHVNGNGHHVSVKARTNTNRLSNGDRGNGSNCKGNSLLYRFLIAIVGVFFLVGTLMQGSILILFRHTDLQAASLDIFPQAFFPRSPPSSDDVRFVPRNIVERLLLSRGRVTVAELRNEQRSPVRPARLALVCPNLARSPYSLYSLTIAKGLQILGYSLEVFTLKDGELRSTWEALGVAVWNLKVDLQHGATVDWLNYEGVIAMSLCAKSALNSLAQEPFRNIPVLWVISDDALGRRLGVYESAGARRLVLDWTYSFRRADVMVFPNYALPMIYTTLDTGNFFVIPGSPFEAWEAEEYMLSHSRDTLRAQYQLESEDFAIAVVGSPFLYHGLWKEHALVMRALARALPALTDEQSKGSRSTHLFVIGHGNQSSSYRAAVQVMAEHLGLVNGTVHYVGASEDVTGMLWMSDAVVYASFRDEQAFPPLLYRAMSLQRPVIAPNRSAFRQHIVDGESGLLFPVGDHLKLSEAIVTIRRHPESSAIALAGQSNARDALAINVTLSYGELLESILEFPAEAELPRCLTEAANLFKSGWCWDLLFPLSTSKDTVPFQGFIPSIMEVSVANEDVLGSGIISVMEDEWMLHAGAPQNMLDSMSTAAMTDEADTLTDIDLEEAKSIASEVEAEFVERDELEERKEQIQSTWEDVTKMVRKTEVHKDELHERADGELERTGQPLCIYEPYHGRGAWPFLHQETTLYRGLSISTRGKRPGDDDVDAQLRLPGLLNDSYYRNIFCEYGGFFALANRIDHVHKNAWIGFQPWRASSRKVALTAEAEAALSTAVRVGADGDALYFWARTDGHIGKLIPASPMKQPEDFWANCDSINSGHCREAFVGAFKHMYGLPGDWTEAPPMPTDGGTWSALHCWVLPTSSFVELVLFARMFVDALDSQHYEEHHDHGKCCFARFQREGQHCYCRLLEDLINVWAYHSARRMIYVDPHTGMMQEQHPLESRQGKMWVKFFSHNTLKAMDEDLAEAADDGDRPSERWLWPQTGEVFWQGVLERERQKRWRLKLEKKQKQKEKLARMRYRWKQKALGKFIKPPPGAGYLTPYHHQNAAQQSDPRSSRKS